MTEKEALIYALGAMDGAAAHIPNLKKVADEVREVLYPKPVFIPKDSGVKL